MTDKEIKKALECCTPTNESCLNCPLINVSVPKCAEILYKETLDLINRQQAEIERLRENNKAIMQTIADVHTEAIKEFGEQVKMEYYKVFDEIIPSIMADRIDNLVKEMVGDNK